MTLASMDHKELITEMAYIEKLSTQERLKLARRRRMQQLKKWSQNEKEFTTSKKEKTLLNEAQKKRRESGKGVVFVASVMLLEAAARNDIDEVQELLKTSAVSPNATNEDGLTALHQCCIDDSAEMLELLLQFGADVNAADSEKWTPLHAAATCGHLHLARILVMHGANLLAVNADGNMPYDICEDDATLDYIECEMARRGVTQEMIDSTRTTTETAMLRELKQMKANGESLLVRDGQNATPLHIAAANGYLRVAEFLIQQNFPLELRDVDEWTPLHAAACWGHPDVLELLVQHGASLYARNKNGETPYDICEDLELKDRMIQLLSEQETKRLSDRHKRIKRGHSANTRTQSVRRTSIRDKTLAAKKEAAEEARMRLVLSRSSSEGPKGAAQQDLASYGEVKDINISNSQPALERLKELERIPPQIEPSDKFSVNELTLQQANNSKALQDVELKNTYANETSEVSDEVDSCKDNGKKSLPKTSVHLVKRFDSTKEESHESKSLGARGVTLATSGKRRQENDYGNAFYSPVNGDSKNGVLMDDTEQTGEELNTDGESVYYDDSVNSGYSNTDLVLSHFPSADVHLLEAIDRVTRKRQHQSSSPAGSCPSVVADTITEDSPPAVDSEKSMSVASSPHGLLTSTEDSVVPLLGPQPDLIPESVRCKPPKPAKPEGLCLRRSSIDRPFQPPPVPSPASSQSSSLNIEGPTPTFRVKHTRPMPPPRTSSVKSGGSSASDSSGNLSKTRSLPLSNEVSNNQQATNNHPSVESGNSLQSIPKPSVPRRNPAYSISVNGTDASLASSSSEESKKSPSVITSTAYVASTGKTISSTTTSNLPASTAVIIPGIAKDNQSPVAENALATSQRKDMSDDEGGSSFDKRHNSGIDIHVTVTVKPCAPGTLADLKQQRSLNRGGPAPDTLSLNGGEDNKGYETLSGASESTPQYRAPVSPTLTPRRYHGQPSEYPSPAESRSCCVIL